MYLRTPQTKAFSLVEVVLAVGVITFACITLIGLLTNALTTIRHAIGTTVQAQIMQSLVNNAEVQNYNSGSLTNSAGASPQPTTLMMKGLF